MSRPMSVPAAALGDELRSPSTEALLECREISKRFGTTTALDGASLRLMPGEIVSVTGPSGSGKSTLLHCAAGIVAPDAGEVIFDGRSVGALPDAERSRLRRSEFGFLFQFGRLVPELSCLENVALPLRLSGFTRRGARQAADAWLDRLAVSEVGARLPGEVSGGQGQRVAVARALVTSPQIVFADEPTGALDSLSGETVMNLLVSAARNSGTAILLVTHEARVAAYADREVVVRDGRTRTI